MRYNRYLKGSLLLCNYQFTFSYYTPHFEMENNGHTLKVGVAEAGAGVLLLGTGYFLLDQFHFHWGSENDKGSEHQFNGKSFSAEVRRSSGPRGFMWKENYENWLSLKIFRTFNLLCSCIWKARITGVSFSNDTLKTLVKLRKLAMFENILHF